MTYLKKKTEDIENVFDYSYELIQKHNNSSELSRIQNKLFLKIGVLAMSNIKCRNRINCFVDVVKSSLNSSSIEIRASASSSFSKILLTLPKDLSTVLLADFLDFALNVTQLHLREPQHLHGIIYCLAEIIRHGAYKELYDLHSFFILISSVWKFCLFFEAKQTAIAPTLSAAVRDSACYLAWSIAKFISREFQNHLQDLLHLILPELICIALFDVDINCRRASAATIQIWLGKCFYENGVNIIQIINFNSVTLKNESFLRLSLHYVQLNSDFGPNLVLHLVECKRFCKDEQIRTLASEAFSQLFSFMNEKFQEDIICLLEKDVQSKDSVVLHGTFYFYSTVLGKLKNVKFQKIAFNSNVSVQDSYLHYIIRFCGSFILNNEDFLYCLSFVKQICEKKTTPVNLLRKCTFGALQMILNQAVHLNEHWDYFCSKFVSASNFQFLYACFSFPTEFLSDKLKHLLPVISDIYLSVNVDIKKEILFSIKSLLTRNISFEENCMDFVKRIISIAIDDYTVDHRGDIGSIVRMETLEILYELIEKGILVDFVFPKILRILLEKMDKFRPLAWRIILASNQYSRIQKYFSEFLDIKELDTIYTCAMNMILQLEDKEIVTNAVIGLLKSFNSNILYIQQPVFKSLFKSFSSDSSKIKQFILLLLTVPSQHLSKLSLLEYLIEKFALFLDIETLSLIATYLSTFHSSDNHRILLPVLKSYALLYISTLNSSTFTSVNEDIKLSIECFAQKSIPIIANMAADIKSLFNI